MSEEDYNEYYIQGSDHYLIPKDVFKELFDEMSNWREEAKELKKQLEENKDKINWYENFEVNKTIDKLRIKHNNQQKEFIEYLENKINKIKEEIRTYDIWHEVGVDINFLILKKQLFMEDLQKYKEIIGGKYYVCKN